MYRSGVIRARVMPGTREKEERREGSVGSGSVVMCWAVKYGPKVLGQENTIMENKKNRRAVMGQTGYSLYLVKEK